MIDKLLNINEASKLLNLHPQTVRDLARLGVLKGRKTCETPHGHWRFEKPNLMKWAKEHAPATFRSV